VQDRCELVIGQETSQINYVIVSASLDWEEASVRTSVRLFVCSFVCHQPCEHDILKKKTNQPILMQIGTGSLWNKCITWSTSESGRRRSRSQEAKVRFGGVSE